MSSNLRGILLMVGAMAAFAVEDAGIKFASATVSLGLILVVIGLGGATAFLGMARASGHRLTREILLSPVLLARNLGELASALGGMMALSLVPLSTVSAIAQASPLLTTAGAALFLAESVGWRRWLAVAIGFAGVMLILRPGAAAFDPNALWAVAGVIGLSARDLITRRMRPGLPTTLVSFSAFVWIVALGVALMLAGGTRPAAPGADAAAVIALVVVMAICGYWMLVEATRAGDLAVIAPFRYSRLVFALILAVALFGERPDAATLAGSALIIGSGLYALYREQRRGRAAQAALPDPSHRVTHATKRRGRR